MNLSEYNHVLMRVEENGRPVCMDLLKEKEGGGFTGYWTEFTPFRLLNCKIVTDDEYRKIVERYYCTDWCEITRAEFDEAYEVLPSLGHWSFEDGFAFQSSEILSNNITATYATCAGKYYHRTMARVYTKEHFNKHISRPITQLRYGGE